MKRVAETLGVARSNVIAQLAPRRRAPRPRPDDERLLPLIRAICDERPTYGYRRVTALLNRQLVADSKPRVNPKRIYRIMRLNALLLPKAGVRRPTRTHDGQVITLKSNLRWCSDAFEIRCDNADTVRVAFSLDCCDREVIRWVATTGGISGELVRDLMVETLEARFGTDARAAPHPIEWLSDNGPCYTAADTVAFGRSLGFLVCTTPPYSPESNGMAEAFVKTFKRDYVALNPIPNAATVLAQLDDWFEDYNEVHPHKGLRMRSPREARRMAK